jgi:hypothetical protein
MVLRNLHHKAAYQVASHMGQLALTVLYSHLNNFSYSM